MAISIKEMKNRVQSLEREDKRLSDTDGYLSKFRERKNNLCVAFEADILCDASWRVIDALNNMVDTERGVSSDANLEGAQSRIRAEINHLKKAIQLKEEAERQMREAQQKLGQVRM